MRFRRESSGLVLVCLERGERVRVQLEQLCLDLAIEGAQLSGIGGLRDPELGYWLAASGEYSRRTLPGDWELLSLQGNVSGYQGKPFVHAHAVLSGPDFQVVGGHFLEAEVTATAEIFLCPCQAIVRHWHEGVRAGLWVDP